MARRNYSPASDGFECSFVFVPLLDVDPNPHASVTPVSIMRKTLILSFLKKLRVHVYSG